MRNWTPEARAAQAALIRNWRPWKNSTGPKTVEGKAKCSRNALKHGLYSRATRAMRDYLKLARQRILAVRAMIKNRQFVITPELLPIFQNRGMEYYESAAGLTQIVVPAQAGTP